MDTDASRLNDEQAREIAFHPDMWSQYFRTIDGKPFLLDKRPYLKEIYRHFGMHAPKGDRTRIIVLKCSRKVEKTETICNLLLYTLLNLPYFKAVYTAPRQPQVTRFVEERFNGAMRSSINGGCLKKYRIKQSVAHQTFDVGASEYNHFYAYSAWGDAHGLLGVECDLVCVDEFQDVPQDVLPMLTEMMSLSPYKWALISGTAREQGSDFWKLWEMTDKRKWDEETGEWIAGNPDADLIGYHIDQRMHCEITDEELEYKRQLYTPRKYHNEVLGQFWAGSVKPLTMMELLQCCDEERGIVRAIDAPEESVMGVDWGNETVVCIMDKNKNIITFERVQSRDDADDEIAVIKRLIEKYNCTQVMCDIGFGARQTRELQREYGERVRSCYYSKRPMNPFEYKKRDSNRNLIYMCVVDRTTYVEKVLWGIEKQDYSFPYKDDSIDWALEQMTTINSSAEEDLADNRPTHAQRTTKYGRDGDDHAFHALVYATLAVEVADEYGLPTIRTFGI